MGILKIENLHKSFGSHKVLDGLFMDIPENSIFGFVGQNGSGKTTTMKIALGLLKADGGDVFVCDEKVTCGETKTNANIGYLPDVPEFYGYMKPQEYLTLCGEITGLSAAKIKTRSEELLMLVGLFGEKKKIGGFSRGMKQRLGVAQALLNEPKLLICDEPTSALDPIGRKEILEILREVKGKTTVVFSTHILSDVERICDRIAVLHKGKLTLSGTISEVKEKRRQNKFIIEFSDINQIRQFLSDEMTKKLSNNFSQNENILTVNLDDAEGQGGFLIDILSRQKIVPLKFEHCEPTLESLYTEVTL